MPGSPLESILAAVRGGRVVHTGFLDPGPAARLASELQARGISVHLAGGYPGARRRVLTAYPSHVPQAGRRLAAMYFDGCEEAALLEALNGVGLDEGERGDLVPHQEGVSLITVGPLPDRLTMPITVGERQLSGQEVALEHVGGGKVVHLRAVVPSLRVDVLGARAFGVSRAFFGKGIAGGRVLVAGQRADKAAQVQVGQEVYAEGLGRFLVVGLEGLTRRGNQKVELEVERR